MHAEHLFVLLSVSAAPAGTACCGSQSSCRPRASARSCRRRAPAGSHDTTRHAMRPTVADLLVALAVAELRCSPPCGCCSPPWHSRSPTARSSSRPGRCARRRTGRSRCSRCSSAARCSTRSRRPSTSRRRWCPGGHDVRAGHRAAELGEAVAAQRPARGSSDHRTRTAPGTPSRAGAGSPSARPRARCRPARSSARNLRRFGPRPPSSFAARSARRWLTPRPSSAERLQLRERGQREEGEVGRGRHEQQEREPEQLLVREHRSDAAAGPERDRDRGDDRAEVDHDVDRGSAACRPCRSSRTIRSGGGGRARARRSR